MSLYILAKLALAPLLIWSATLAARRWGNEVAGTIAGLPLTSAPLSVILAAEQGTAYATTAARATVAGLLAVVAFVAAYAVGARRFAWPASLVGASTAYVATATILAWLAPGLTTSLLLLGAALVPLLNGPFRRGSSSPVSRRLGSWDIPLRMLIAAATIMMLSALASDLGAKWTGVLSAAPVFAAVMLLFCHGSEDWPEVRRIARGILSGTISFAVFFCAVAMGLPSLGMTAYAGALVLAAATALAFRQLDAGPRDRAGSPKQRRGARS